MSLTGLVQAAPAKKEKKEKQQTIQELFAAEKYDEALKKARALAKKGDAEALYLLGFSSETGRGTERSIKTAMDFYQQAKTKGSSDAAYRICFLQLASQDQKERDQAITSLKEMAKKDPAVAGRILGEAYLSGKASEKPDPEQALEWWEKAGKANDIPSLIFLADFHEGKLGSEKMADLPRAVSALKRAAELGNGTAMLRLGTQLLHGAAEIRDVALGEQWLEKAAATKQPDAHWFLGIYAENGKKDDKAALKHYENGQAAGQLACAAQVGIFYLQGRAVERDEKKGIEILKKAAEDGGPLAHYQLALLELRKEKPDDRVAHQHLVQAASGNLAAAQNEIGVFYLSGKFLERDPVAAVAWFSRAVQQRHAQAANNLAKLYERGIGTEKNLTLAANLYTMAAEQGHPEATLSLAILHANDASSDLPRAWALAKYAEQLGEKKESANVLKQLEAKMTPEQLAKGKAEFAKTQPSKP